MDVRYRSIPPVGPDRPETVARALPTEPTRTDDCCGWLVDRDAAANRDVAREWLVFLTALGLADRTAEGYARADDPPEEAAIRRAFVERVYGARELLEALLEDGPVEARQLSRALDGGEGDGSWTLPDVDRETYVERVLGWAVELGVLEASDDGYRLGSVPPGFEE